MRFTESEILHAIAALFLLTVGLVCGNCWSSMARANDDAPSTAQHALALGIAKTTAHEAGFRSPRDVALIFEAANYHGRGNDARALRWLRRHSPRANDGTGCPERLHDGTTPNCAWTPHLGWSNARPRGWPSDARWAPEQWQRVRELALRLVRGEETRRVCPVPIVTWGRASDRDFVNGLRVRIDCGAENLGGTTPELIRRAARARARPKAVGASSGPR